MPPVAVVKIGSRTAVLVSSDDARVALVEMTEGPLTVTRYASEDYESAGWSLIDYPLARAVEVYLRHAAGVTREAREALRTNPPETLEPLEMSLEQTLQDIATTLRDQTTSLAHIANELANIRKLVAGGDSPAGEAPEGKRRGAGKKNTAALVQPEQPATEDTPAATPSVTLEDLKGRATKLIAAGKKAEVVAEVGRFGVAKVSDLPADKWDAFSEVLCKLETAAEEECV